MMQVRCISQALHMLGFKTTCCNVKQCAAALQEASLYSLHAALKSLYVGHDSGNDHMHGLLTNIAGD